MSILKETQRSASSAPNAILKHMRRRVARVGLLVAAISTLLASLVIFVICACAHIR
jgi:hypothetical protein